MPYTDEYSSKRCDKDLTYKQVWNILEKIGNKEFIIVNFAVGRKRSKYYLFNPVFVNQYVRNATIKANRTASAFIIEPGGNQRLVVLQGGRMSRGKWADEFTGYYVVDILAKEYLIEEKYWTSSGGGLSATLAVFALPMSLNPTPLAKIKRRLTAEETGTFILYSDGTEQPEIEL